MVLHLNGEMIYKMEYQNKIIVIRQNKYKIYYLRTV